MTTLSDFRDTVTSVLATTLGTEIAIIDHIPDSIAPPAVVFGWGNPWIVYTTWCEYTTTSELIVVSQRIEPGGHLATIESLVLEIMSVLREARISIRDVSAPYPIQLGGVNYLAASVNVIHELGD